MGTFSGCIAVQPQEPPWAPPPPITGMGIAAQGRLARYAAHLAREPLTAGRGWPRFENEGAEKSPAIQGAADEIAKRDSRDNTKWTEVHARDGKRGKFVERDDVASGHRPTDSDPLVEGSVDGRPTNIESGKIDPARQGSGRVQGPGSELRVRKETSAPGTEETEGPEKGPDMPTETGEISLEEDATVQKDRTDPVSEKDQTVRWEPEIEEGELSDSPEGNPEHIYEPMTIEEEHVDGEASSSLPLGQANGSPSQIRTKQTLPTRVQSSPPAVAPSVDVDERPGFSTTFGVNPSVQASRGGPLREVSGKPSGNAFPRLLQTHSLNPLEQAAQAWAAAALGFRMPEEGSEALPQAVKAAVPGVPPVVPVMDQMALTRGAAVQSRKRKAVKNRRKKTKKRPKLEALAGAGEGREEDGALRDIQLAALQWRQASLAKGSEESLEKGPEDHDVPGGDILWRRAAPEPIAASQLATSGGSVQRHYGAASSLGGLQTVDSWQAVPTGPAGLAQANGQGLGVVASVSAKALSQGSGKKPGEGLSLRPPGKELKGSGQEGGEGGSRQRLGARGLRGSGGLAALIDEEEADLWESDEGEEAEKGEGGDEGDGAKRTRMPLTAEQKERRKAVKRKKRAAQRIAEGRPHCGLRAAEKTKNAAPPVCRFWMEGRCSKGEECAFSHGAVPNTKSEVCKFFLQNCCLKGQDCMYSHNLAAFPCKFYHIRGMCLDGATCRFSHAPLSAEEREKLKQRVEQEIRERHGGGAAGPEPHDAPGVDAPTAAHGPRGPLASPQPMVAGVTFPPMPVRSSPAGGQGPSPRGTSFPTGSPLPADAAPANGARTAGTSLASPPPSAAGAGVPRNPLEVFRQLKGSGGVSHPGAGQASGGRVGLVEARQRPGSVQGASPAWPSGSGELGLGPGGGPPAAVPPMDYDRVWGSRHLYSTEQCKPTSNLGHRQGLGQPGPSPSFVDLGPEAPEPVPNERAVAFGAREWNGVEVGNREEGKDEMGPRREGAALLVPARQAIASAVGSTTLECAIPPDSPHFGPPLVRTPLTRTPVIGGRLSSQFGGGSPVWDLLQTPPLGSPRSVPGGTTPKARSSELSLLLQQPQERRRAGTGSAPLDRAPSVAGGTSLERPSLSRFWNGKAPAGQQSSIPSVADLLSKALGK